MSPDVGRLAVSTAGRIADAVQAGRVTPLFQPIEALQTGECRGFEALARLNLDDALLMPDVFLPHLGTDDRLSLFGTMLGGSIALMKSLSSKARTLASPASGAECYVSINVEISLIVSEDFVDVLQYYLERHDFSGERLVLEILENEEVGDLSLLHRRLEAIRRLGLSIALDDIGSGFSSLTKIKQLAIDIVKLDRAFCLDLERRLDDLMFVMSMQSLARGLGKKMIVEGIETAEVYDGLRMLGVELGQGYVIARPMPAADVAGWLASRQPRKPDRVPRCMLGAYASMLSVMESCRMLRNQPLPIAWTPAAADAVGCVVGQYFDRAGWIGTPCDTAHQAFHAVLPFYDSEPDRWAEVAKTFQDAMAAVIAADDGKIDAVPPPKRASRACGCIKPAAVKSTRRRFAASR